MFEYFVLLVSVISAFALGSHFGGNGWGIGAGFIAWFIWGFITETPESREMSKKMAQFSSGEISKEDLQFFLDMQSTTMDMPKPFQDFVKKSLEENGLEATQFFLERLFASTTDQRLQQMPHHEANQLRFLLQLGQSLDAELLQKIMAFPADEIGYPAKAITAVVIRSSNLT